MKHSVSVGKHYINLSYILVLKHIHGSVSECWKCNEVWNAHLSWPTGPSHKLVNCFPDFVTTISDMHTELAFAHKKTLLFAYIAKFQHNNHLIQDHIHLDKQNVEMHSRECENGARIHQCGPAVLNSGDLRYITNHSYEKTNPRCPQTSVQESIISKF